MKLTEQSKKLGELWRALSTSDKLPYTELARLDRQRYDEEKKKITPKQKTRPLSAYNFYVQEMRPKTKQSIPVIAKQWKELSDEQKQVYKSRALTAAATFGIVYETELVALVDTMLEYMEQHPTHQVGTVLEQLNIHPESNAVKHFVAIHKLSKTHVRTIKGNNTMFRRKIKTGRNCKKKIENK